MAAWRWSIGLISAAAILFSLPGVGLADNSGATLQADASRIDADIAQLQQDQAKLHQRIEPDKKTVAAAQKQLDTDAAPLLAKLAADEQQNQTALQAQKDAIKLARTQGEPGIHALEANLSTSRRRAAKDKSIAAQIPAQEAQLKAARDKLHQDIQTMRQKLKADTDSGKKALDAERQAMATALKTDTDALHAAQSQLQSDLLWQTKVAADQATLDADRQKLAQDRQTAGV